MSQLREQRAIHTSSSDRQRSSLAQRGSARSEPLPQPSDMFFASRHRAGHSSGIHPEDQPYQSETLRRRLPPPSRTEEEADDPPRTRSSAIRRYVTTTPIPHPRPRRRWHPLFRIGLFGIAMVVCTTALLIIPPRYQHWQDDLHYGYPRTYQT